MVRGGPTVPGITVQSILGAVTQGETLRNKGIVRHGRREKAEGWQLNVNRSMADCSGGHTGGGTAVRAQGVCKKKIRTFATPLLKVTRTWACRDWAL